MSDPVTVAKWIFRIAGIYGLIILIPFFFAEEWVGRHAPPPITHPEYYYGFLGAATVMQLVYLTISTDPVRYKVLMPIAVLAKLSFAVPVSILFLTGRLEAATLPLPMVDLMIGLAFGFAWLRMPRTA